MARIWLARFDPKLVEVFRRLFLGLGIKTVGYLIIAAGIFFSIKDKDIALFAVILGAFLVIFGWMLIYRALKTVD
mgnify:CR=1 FL=1